MSTVYGPQEATGSDVDQAEVNVIDAELDLAYTEASYQRGHLGRWAEADREAGQ